MVAEIVAGSVVVLTRIIVVAFATVVGEIFTSVIIDISGEAFRASALRTSVFSYVAGMMAF